MIFSCGDKDKTKKLEDRIAELEKNKDEGNLPKEIAEEILEDGHIENKRINYCDVLFSDSSINQRNIYEVLINRYDQLLVEGERIDVFQLREEAKDFINNNGKDPTLSDSPEKAIFLIQKERHSDQDDEIDIIMKLICQ